MAAPTLILKISQHFLLIYRFKYYAVWQILHLVFSTKAMDADILVFG